MKKRGEEKEAKKNLVEYIGGVNKPNIRNQEGNDTMSAAAEREDPDEKEQRQLMNLFLGTAQAYGGKWSEIFGGVGDERARWKIRYPIEVMLFSGVLMYTCQLGSRRQVNYRLRGNGAVRKKYRALFGVKDVPHGDSLNYSYQQLKVAEVQETVCRLMERVMATAEFQQQRLFGIYFLVAMDGTGVLVYHERHCEGCLTRKLNNGTLLYYHPVLEAKLVTRTGYALSLMTEFIENSDPQATKQDCELKGFYRLVERLKQRFPRLDFCLLLDGLFAGGPTLEKIEKQNWKYLITLTDADLPSVNQEFEALLTLPPDSHLTLPLPSGGQQAFRWVNTIDYCDSDNRHHPLNVVECAESIPDTQGCLVTTKFKWITNFTLLARNVSIIANQAGRLRWKIENEGFNFQKHGGFALEHAFSHHEIAHKVFYLLLQMAIIFYQLMAKSPFLAKAFPDGLGALKNIAFRLLESWRNLRLDDQAFLVLTTLPVDTS